MQKRILGKNKAAPKKMVAILLPLLVIFSLAACSNQNGGQEPAPPVVNDGGENHSVGVIEKGNTHIIADMIAEETGADMFEIQPVNPYPDTYDECTDVAKQEQNDNARPEIVGNVDNMEQYDTVFLGYP